MIKFVSTSKTSFGRWLEVIRSKDSFANRTSTILTLTILFLWLGLTIFTASRHEFWRDEVRALSIVQAANSPVDLYTLTRDEGHPVLWYLLLYIGKSVANTALVLPFLSILIAFAAVVLFTSYSPFPLWFKGLFIFSALPFYEYSVMARNYGISMLLLFLGAMLYQKKSKHPLWFALVLALLANTNVHSTILVFIIAMAWVWELIVEQRFSSARVPWKSFCFPFAVVIAGILLSIVWTWPSRETIVTPVHSLTFSNAGWSILEAALRPEQTFSAIMPGAVPMLITFVLLWLAILGLWHRSSFFLAALGLQFGLGLFFRLIYPAGHRHQGLFFIFLLFLYWISIESFKERNSNKLRMFNLGLYVAMVGLLFGSVAKAGNLVQKDITREWSSSKSFGESLNGSAKYRDAILLPEPDYLIESLPYYSENLMYLPREHRSGKITSFTKKSDAHLSLSELLTVAREIKTRETQRVLIVLGHPEVKANTRGEKKYSFNKIFTWNDLEAQEFFQSTELVWEFKSAYSDENYRIYSVK
jgi:hypothetical protein